MPITSSGIGSGVDIRGLVNDLLKAEGEAKSISYDKEEANNLAKITAFGTLRSSLSDFELNLNSLSNLNDFQQRKASFDDAEILTATTSSNSTAGTYAIEVTQLAKNHKLSSQDFADISTVIGTGNLVFTIGTVQHTVSITQDNETLTGIKNKINETSSTTGISATIVTTDLGSRIIFSAKDEGVDNIFTVAVNLDNDGNDTDNSGLSRLASDNLAISQTGIDSIIEIDGATVTSSTNIVKDAILGVTLNLKKTNVGDVKNLNISQDKDAAKSKITKFVDGYNQVIDSLNELTSFNNKGPEKQVGVLLGDATARNLQMQIRREINSALNISIGYKHLAEIGITSSENDGKLQINSSKLDSALVTNFDSVGNLFAGKDIGVAPRLKSVIKTYTQSNGILDVKTQGLNKSIELINDKREDLDRRLVKLEKSLLKQFMTMDSVVANLRSTSDYLTTQLAQLPEPLSYRRK